MAVWKLGNSAPPLEARDPAGVVNDLQFSLDEQCLAIAGRDLTMRPLARFDEPLILRKDGRNYGTVRFSPAEDTILTIDGKGTIEILNAKTGLVMRSVCCSTIGGAVAFTPDGARFISGGHLPRMWDVRTGALVSQMSREREFMTLGPIAFRGDQVLMGSQDGGIHVWNWRTGQSFVTSSRTQDWVDTIAVQEQTGLVAYAGIRKALRTWNPDSKMDAIHPTSNIVFASPNGLLAVGLANGTVELWDIERGVRHAAIAFPEVPRAGAEL